MSINKLLIAAVLAIAIGAPISGFVLDKEQPMTSTGVQAPFLHGFPVSQIGNSSELHR